MPQPIVACVASLNCKCLPVLVQSVRSYAPNWTLAVAIPPKRDMESDDVRVARNILNKMTRGLFVQVFLNTSRNFGDAYNELMDSVYEVAPNLPGVVLLNDDAVLTPRTAETLEATVRYVTANWPKVGFVAARADSIRPSQSMVWSKEARELTAPALCDVVSPVCAWMSHEAFKEVRFPSLNWGSDDVACLDLRARGYEHFISTAYVHHVGSVHVDGPEGLGCTRADAKAWVRENRPQYLKHIFGEEPVKT